MDTMEWKPNETKVYFVSGRFFADKGTYLGMSSDSHTNKCKVKLVDGRIISTPKDSIVEFSKAPRIWRDISKEVTDEERRVVNLMIELQRSLERETNI